VRADGHQKATPGQPVTLDWPAGAEHFFDAEGKRLR
jgi:hypothetical protein